MPVLQYATLVGGRLFPAAGPVPGRWSAALQLFSGPVAGHTAGWPILACGVPGYCRAAITMLRVGETPDASDPTREVVTGGPYAHSRNPISVAMTVSYVGVTLILNTAWPLFFLPAVLPVRRFAIVSREERYLDALSGDAYVAHRNHVRRWR